MASGALLSLSQRRSAGEVVFDARERRHTRGVSLPMDDAAARQFLVQLDDRHARQSNAPADARACWCGRIPRQQSPGGAEQGSNCPADTMGDGLPLFRIERVGACGQVAVL